MDQIRETHHLSISIMRSFESAYEFLAEPTNFPKWATGLGTLQKVGEQWIADTPDGPMQVLFSERNSFGVLDHWVTPKTGIELYIPFRALKNGSGSELVFTLFRQSGMSDEKFKADAAWVQRDLLSAKTMLESYAA